MSTDVDYYPWIYPKKENSKLHVSFRLRKCYHISDHLLRALARLRQTPVFTGATPSLRASCHISDHLLRALHHELYITGFTAYSDKIAE